MLSEEHWSHLHMECLQQRCYVTLTDCLLVSSSQDKTEHASRNGNPTLYCSHNVLSDLSSSKIGSQRSFCENVVVKQEPFEDANFAGTLAIGEGGSSVEHSRGRIRIADAVTFGKCTGIGNTLASNCSEEIVVDNYGLLSGTISENFLDITSLTRCDIDDTMDEKVEAGALLGEETTLVEKHNVPGTSELGIADFPPDTSGLVKIDSPPDTSGLGITDFSPDTSGLVIIDSPPDTSGLGITDFSPDTSGLVIIDSPPDTSGLAIMDSPALSDGAVEEDGILNDTSFETIPVKLEPTDLIVSTSKFSTEDWVIADGGEYWEMTKDGRAIRADTYSDTSDDDRSVVVGELLEPVWGDALFRTPSVMNSTNGSVELKAPYSHFLPENLEKLLQIRQCPYCNEVAKSLLELIDHIVKHRASDDRFTCWQPGCEGSYENPHDVLSHVIQCHLNDARFRCFICGMQSHTFLHAKIHLDSHGAGCLQCGIDLKNGYSLDDHLWESHCNPSGELECKYCEQKFKTANLHKTHMRAHFGMAKVRCKFCDEWFRLVGGREGGICEHIKSCHQNASQSLTCPACLNYTTRSVVNLSVHWVNACSKHRCDICKQFYSWGSSRLYGHRLVCQKGERPFKCPNCPQCFNNKQHLSQHFIIKHDRDKAMRCPDVGCNFVTAANQRYQQHIFKHHGITEGVSDANKLACTTFEYPYFTIIPPTKRAKVPVFVCRFPGCDFTENPNAALKTHVLEEHFSKRRSISGTAGRFGYGPQKNTICMDCGHLLRDNHALSSHQSSCHDKPTKHNCKMCGIVFESKTEWQRHVTQQHVRKPSKSSPTPANNSTQSNNVLMGKTESETGFRYNCTVCDYVTNSKVCFTRHQGSKVHKGRFKPPKNSSAAKCPLCEFIPSQTVGPKAIRRHLFVHYRNGETIPEGFTVDICKCPLCAHETCSLGHLRRHMKVHFKQGDMLPDGTYQMVLR